MLFSILSAAKFRFFSNFLSVDLTPQSPVIIEAILWLTPKMKHTGLLLLTTPLTKKRSGLVINILNGYIREALKNLVLKGTKAH